METPQNPHLLKEGEVSAMLGISLGKLRNDRFLRRGLPFVRIGSSVRYRHDVVVRFIEANTVETEPQVAVGAGR